MLPIFVFLLFGIGWVWTIVLGFKESILWGVLNLLFPPISTIIFAIKTRSAFVPTLMVVFGVLGWGYVLYLVSMLERT